MFLEPGRYCFWRCRPSLLGVQSRDACQVTSVEWDLAPRWHVSMVSGHKLNQCNYHFIISDSATRSIINHLLVIKEETFNNFIKIEREWLKYFIELKYFRGLLWVKNYSLLFSKTTRAYDNYSHKTTFLSTAGTSIR